MGETKGDYLGFLESIYGRTAVDQITQMSGMTRADVEKASEAFAPLFLKSLIDARSQSHKSHSGADMPTFADLWPSEMNEAMQTFMTQSSEAAKNFAPSSSDDATAFPFNILSQQASSMEKLYQVFMGQVAQAQLLNDVSKATGVSPSQLQTLYPMLTTYGLMPMMSQMAPYKVPPAMDDPAGWVDYLGELSRKGFRMANKELDAMPSPVNAAFDGLLAGMFPKAPDPEPVPDPSDSAQQVRDASLELQANYIKGLNSLFESYAAGLNGDKSDKG